MAEPTLGQTDSWVIYLDVVDLDGVDAMGHSRSELMVLYKEDSCIM